MLVLILLNSCFGIEFYYYPDIAYAKHKDYEKYSYYMDSSIIDDDRL